MAAEHTLAQAAKLTRARLRRLLTEAGRQRHLDRDIERLRAVFTDTYLHQPPVVENAIGIHLSALLRQFDAACAAADELAEAAIAHLSNTRTPRSSPAPVWGCWPVPGCWPRSATTAPAR